jgi:hypothetical protein
MYVPERERRAHVWGAVLGLFVLVIFQRYFSRVLYAACPCNPPWWTAEGSRLTEKWWPLRIISVLATLPIYGLFIYTWRRGIAYSMKSKEERQIIARQAGKSLLDGLETVVSTLFLVGWPCLILFVLLDDQDVPWPLGARVVVAALAVVLYDYALHGFKLVWRSDHRMAWLLLAVGGGVLLARLFHPYAPPLQLVTALFVALFAGLFHRDAILYGKKKHPI